ncbi:MAG: hypothetical protein WD059_07610 [Balneolaceae bacterium]
MNKPYLKHVLFLLAGFLLLGIPLLRDFHFESAILVAVIGCFWAGLQAAKPSSNQDFFTSLRILGFLYLTGIPLFLYALFTDCLTVDGIGFWLLIPFPSVYFGAAVGRLVRKFHLSFPLTITTTILIFCAAGIWLLEFLNFPQVYFYNHVWGVWPGPIYDEAVQISGSFFFFRWLTFLWIILLWILPSWNRDIQTKLITGLAVIALMLSYLNLDEFGIISPYQTIQQQLGGLHQTEHFDIYFDDEFYSEDEITYWGQRHEFHFHQLVELLKIDWPQNRKIESYLYAHAWQKKKITGAKFTSYVPVWLEQDQLHIAKHHLERVLKHELVHVISKQFGNRLFNASLSIGLIEGAAEGIAKDASPQSTLHQIVASEKPYPTAEEMKLALSIAGFYSSASAISYTTAGSFVDYLLKEFPVEDFKRAYPSGDFEEAYSHSFEDLVEGWHQKLVETEIDSVDRRISEFIFAQRSLFQKTCPHSVSRELRLWDEYRFRLADEDSTTAHKKLDELFELDNENELVHAEWISSKLHRGEYEEVLASFSEEDTLLTIQVLHADALYLNESYHKADSLLQFIAPDIQNSEAINFRYSLQLREDSLTWHHHTQRRYAGYLPDSTEFEQLNMANKVENVGQAIEKDIHQKLLRYSYILLKEEAHPDWFDIYRQQIGRLIFLKEFELAEQWLEKVSRLDLRLRHQEILEELYEWYEFSTFNRAD